MKTNTSKNSTTSWAIEHKSTGRRHTRSFSTRKAAREFIEGSSRFTNYKVVKMGEKIKKGKGKKPKFQVTEPGYEVKFNEVYGCGHSNSSPPPKTEYESYDEHFARWIKEFFSMFDTPATKSSKTTTPRGRSVGKFVLGTRD